MAHPDQSAELLSNDLEVATDRYGFIAVFNVELTGKQTPAYQVQCKEVAQYQALGTLNVIAKPLDPTTPAAQVKQIWDQRS